MSAAVFLIIIVLRNSGRLEFLELAAYDWFMRLRPTLSRSDPRVVIVAITEQDISREGHWPLTDATLARTLATLLQCRPRVIGLDVFRDISVPPGSRELESILLANQNIIVVTKFGEKGVQPPPILRNREQIGFNDVIVDPGGIVRRGLLFLDDGQTAFYSFALRLTLLYLRDEGIVPRPDASSPQHLKLGQTRTNHYTPF